MIAKIIALLKGLLGKSAAPDVPEMEFQDFFGRPGPTIREVGGMER